MRNGVGNGRWKGCDFGEEKDEGIKKKQSEDPPAAVSSDCIGQRERYGVTVRSRAV